MKRKASEEGPRDDGADRHKQKVATAPAEAPSLEMTLQALPQLIQRRQEELDQREADLRKAEEAFAKETGKAYGSTKPNDVLHLNVGGTRCDVLRRTLCQVEDSMLASRFSGRWDETIEKDRDGNYFIDQPFEIFKPFVDFLRAKQNSTPRAPPVTAPMLGGDFIRMVEYYGCTPGVYPTEVEMYRGEPGKAKLTTYPNLAVDTSEWATFTLNIKGHSRRIVAYEIELGQVERALIGWIDPDYFAKKSGEETWKGVGEEHSSVALDCCGSSLLKNGNSSQTKAGSTKTLTSTAGTIIRCDLDGKRWLVDGEVVVSPETHDNIWYDEEMDEYIRPRSLIPAFSGKGQWSIKDVVLSSDVV